MSQDTWPPTDAADAYGWLRNWPRTRAAVEFAVFCELVEPCPAGPFRDLLRRCRSGAPPPPFVARALAANRSVVMVHGDHVVPRYVALGWGATPPHVRRAYRVPVDLLESAMAQHF